MSSLTTTSIQKYTLGLRVDSTTDPFLHVTIAYLGDCNLDKLAEIKKAMNDAATINFLPCRLIVGKSDMFGPKNDIPVRYVSFNSPMTEQLMKSFYDKFGQPELDLDKMNEVKEEEEKKNIPIIMLR